MISATEIVRQTIPCILYTAMNQHGLLQLCVRVHLSIRTSTLSTHSSSARVDRLTCHNVLKGRPSFFFAFSRKIHEFQHFVLRFAQFFPPRQNTAKKIAKCRQKPDKAEHRAGARYEPCAPRIATPTVRDRPGPSPASFPGHGWSQKAPRITRSCRGRLCRATSCL